MGSFVLTSTEVAPVDSYLIQNAELGEVLKLIKTEGLFNLRNVQVFELAPAEVQHVNGMRLITLRKAGDNSSHTAAEMYLQKALYYARINGHRDEVEVLTHLTKVIYANLKDAQTRAVEVDKEAPPALPTGN